MDVRMADLISDEARFASSELEWLTLDPKTQARLDEALTAMAHNRVDTYVRFHGHICQPLRATPTFG